MLNRIAVLAVVCCLMFSGSNALAQSKSGVPPSEIDRQHTEWISSALLSIQTIKIGMTRSELMTIFTTEGGISTPSQRTYVFRECPYIKVDVKFAASSLGMELATDKIVEISRPYLAWSVID